MPDLTQRQVNKCKSNLQPFFCPRLSFPSSPTRGTSRGTRFGGKYAMLG